MQYKKKKLLIFGIGKFYENRIKILENFSEEIEIIGYLDNVPKEKNYLNKLPVVLPKRYKEFEYDKIVLMSISWKEMRDQLIELGCEEERIWSWEEACCNLNHGNLRIYPGSLGGYTATGRGRKGIQKHQTAKILIITTTLNYNGGTNAAVYAALALKKAGYGVVLAAPGGVRSFIEETRSYGLDIIICPSLPYISEEERFWIARFDMVMVNVFQMIKCACDISQFMPVMWWVHENSGRYDDIYRITRDKYPQYTGTDTIKGPNVIAVSTIAKDNFNDYYPNECKGILSFGIPDERKLSDTFHEAKDKIIFAVVGAVMERKGQDILINAFERLPADIKSKTELWIIGEYGKGNSYMDKLLEAVRESSYIKLFGNLTRHKMQEAYQIIDVVVCASREETMSIAIIEGLMHKKVCITTDATGIADYIENGVNGFVVEAEHIDALSERISWIVSNPDKCMEISANARKTYEEYFTIDSFSKRIKDMVEEIMTHE